MATRRVLLMLLPLLLDAAAAAPSPLDADQAAIVHPGALRQLYTRFSEDLGISVPESELRWLLVTGKAMGLDVDEVDSVAADPAPVGKQVAKFAINPEIPEIPGVPGTSIGLAAVSGVPGVPAVRVPDLSVGSVATSADVDAIPISGKTSSVA